MNYVSISQSDVRHDLGDEFYIPMPYEKPVVYGQHFGLMIVFQSASVHVPVRKCAFDMLHSVFELLNVAEYAVEVALKFLRAYNAPVRQMYGFYRRHAIIP